MNTVDKIKLTMSHHHLSQAMMARYLGVPKSTLIKWLHGERAPGASTDRLIELLALLETIAPGIHAHVLKRGEK